MKKKIPASSKDKKDWLEFTKNLQDVYDKDSELSDKKITSKKIPKLDLHGFSLDRANEEVKKFILDSFYDGYKKLLIITGQGLRSKIHGNPYLSE